MCFWEQKCTKWYALIREKQGKVEATVINRGEERRQLLFVNNESESTIYYCYEKILLLSLSRRGDAAAEQDWQGI